MNEKISTIPIENIENANIYFSKIKQLYNHKMKEYVT